MKTLEVPLSFLCGKNGVRLYGILHQPEKPSRCGLLIVTGRPALRAGRHRLFVLLARAWAEAGIPVMRFDFRGTGDCEGEMGTLDDTSEDIASAIDAFLSNMPGLEGVAMWGLCGGAADSIFYAPKDPRVMGIAMVNPWYYDARVQGLTIMRRYGSAGLGKVSRWLRAAGSSIRGNAGTADSLERQTKSSGTSQDDETDGGNISEAAVPRASAAIDAAYASYRVPNLAQRMANNLEEFKGGVLLILSGQDTGSQAFKHAVSISRRWRRLLSAPRMQSHELPEANHSLRRPEWRAQATAWTIAWLRQLEAQRH
ncbi:MAG: hydrolase 1, exosortase A system-associated [Candidatus Sulfotelmatobacter sp.]